MLIQKSGKLLLSNIFNIGLLIVPKLQMAGSYGILFKLYRLKSFRIFRSACLTLFYKYLSATGSGWYLNKKLSIHVVTDGVEIHQALSN